MTPTPEDNPSLSIVLMDFNRRFKAESHRIPIPPARATVEARTAEECERILQEVKTEGGQALERLRAKCRWEGMGLLAVVREWGDPRTWPGVKS